MSSNLTDPNLSGSTHPSAELHEPLISESGTRRGTHHYTGIPFNISAINPNHSTIPTSLVQHNIHHGHSGQTPSAVVICNHPSAEKEPEEDVSEEFVKNYNEHIGNKENQDKARRLIKKMKVLGGLDPDNVPTQLDIPAARMGFAILAGLKNYQHKMTALENLRKLLAKDEFKKETAIDLVSLAMKVMSKMDRELIQTEIIDVQIEIAKAYGAIAELLQHHYAEKHINAITKELKSQLGTTARTLEDLNRQEDVKLAFAVGFALEGIKRLRDDRKELFEILLRIYHTVMAAASVYQTDMQQAATEIDLAFKGIDINIKSSWYDGAALLHVLARDAKTNYNVLFALQKLIAEKHKDLNWRFLYEAINVLTDIAINGANEKIRFAAFEGLKTIKQDYPGLINFKDYKGFALKPDLSPIVHFEAPKLKNHNIIIRTTCVENLILLAKQSPDFITRKRSKVTLITRLKEETDTNIKTLLRQAIPTNRDDLENWLNESGKYAPVPPAIVVSHVDSKDKNRQIEPISSDSQITTLANQILSPGNTNNTSLMNNPDPKIIPSFYILSPAGSLSQSQLADDDTSVSSVASSAREPNQIAKRLAGCLGVDPEFLSDKLHYKGDIRPTGKTGLVINEKGMADLVELLTTHQKITKLDLGICGKSVEGLNFLFSNLQKTHLNSLGLKAKISRNQAKELALLIHEKKDLKVSLRGSKDYYLLGHALLRIGEITEAISYYTKALSEPSKKDFEKKLQSKLYFRRGLAYMLDGEVELAIEDLSRTMQIDPTFVRGALELSRLYLQEGQKPLAKSWALKAFHLSPTNRDVNKLLKQF